MKFVLADRSHNDGLCELSSLVTMPGSMEIAYLRDPDYFAALDIQGDFHQTIVAIENGRVAGSGSRSIRRLYVNGAPAEVGYLNGLRSHPDHRGGSGLARGYRFLRELHSDGPVPGYLTTIIESNHVAKSVLVGGRAGLPLYRDLGQFHTHTILLNERRRETKESKIRVHRADRADLPELVSFLNDEGKKRQFFPVYELEQFGTDLFRNFRIENWYLARESGKLTGAVGVWDQSEFKRYRIAAYSPLLRRTRKLMNAALRLTGYRPLPEEGEDLSLLHCLSPCIRDDRKEVLRSLIARILADNAAGPHTGIVCGFMEGDPLLESIRSFRSILYKSRLYFVNWEDGEPFFRSLEEARPRHLEAALL